MTKILKIYSQYSLSSNICKQLLYIFNNINILEYFCVNDEDKQGEDTTHINLPNLTDITFRTFSNIHKMIPP